MVNKGNYTKCLGLPKVGDTEADSLLVEDVVADSAKVEEVEGSGADFSVVDVTAIGPPVLACTVDLDTLHSIGHFS